MRILNKTDALVRRYLLSSSSSAAWHKLILRAREGMQYETGEGAAAAVVVVGGDANFLSKSDLAGAVNKTAAAAAAVTHLIPLSLYRNGRGKGNMEMHAKRGNKSGTEEPLSLSRTGALSSFQFQRLGAGMLLSLKWNETRGRLTNNTKVQNGI